MKLRNLTKSVIALSMTASFLASNQVIAFAEETEPAVQEQAQTGAVTYGPNLALGKTATASSEEAATVAASKATDGKLVRENGVPVHWGSNTTGGPDWIYVDLGSAQAVDKINVYWESQKANNYKVQYAVENPGEEDSWTDIVNSDTWPSSIDEEIVLENTIQARYVRVYIGSYSQADHGDNNIANWNSIGIREIEVYAKAQPTNIALDCTATASSVEAGTTFTADKAFDGNTTSTRWSSEDHGDGATFGPDWIYVDLGSEGTITGVNIFWETKKAASYKIQVAAADADLTSADAWSTVKEFSEHPSSNEENITFDSSVTGQYVRLYIENSTFESPDSNEVGWGTISIYEMEVMGWKEGTSTEEPGDIQTLDDALAQCTVTQPSATDTKLTITVPEEAANGITAKYNGADLEQIIDSELNIHKPLVTKTVKVNFKAEDANGEVKFKEVNVTVPGLYDVSVNDNSAPVILPELQEWKGEEGVFTIGAAPKVVYTDDSFKAAADSLAADYEEMTGKAMSVVKGTAADAAAGDIVLAKGDEDGDMALGKEGYYAEIDDVIEVTAADPTGAYWSTRTILQALKADDTMSEINKGLTRDYPTYEIRGLILDVGRKTFKMDYLQQMVKQMAWYKLNDFQIHLNDNLIPLETYSNKGEDPMQAYSAFRLESDIKEGGNDGLNKADLTAKDVWYTKEDFKNLILDAREMGVNIVPEIDTPAHSLALTKVRPDLRLGTNGRQNDHLNLSGKYDEALEFVQSIFTEYLSGEDPVWDQDTTIHIGADEFSSSSVAYRKFVNDMIDFVQNSGRKARVWGSFSQLAQGDPINAENVEINLWNYGWAHMKDMYLNGFDLINCNDGNYYIVPNAGYYYDYLNDGTMYNLAINSIGGDTIPAGDAQMKGGAFAVWNDMTDYQENGMTEYDIYKRISKNMGLFAAKLWGKGNYNVDQATVVQNSMGDAPGTNFGYAIESKTDAILHLPMNDTKDASGNENDLGTMDNASIDSVDHKNALRLYGDNSTAETGLTTAGLGNDLRIKVKRLDDGVKDQILFESPYGTIKAVQGDTGQVGISRENRDYSFNYTLPVGEWVELEFKNNFEQIELYVNGKLIDTLGDGDELADGRVVKATCMFPVATVGAKENAFNGYVDDIRLGTAKDFNSTMDLDYLVAKVQDAGLTDSVDGLPAALEEAKAIIEKYDPTAEEIEEAINKINDLTEDADYEKADYSKVEAYESISGKLENFTAETREVVERALAMVRKDLPKANQSIVDGYVKTIEAALDGLQKKVSADLNFVDPSTLTATDSSHQDAGSSASKALDGDLSTMWHSQWNITSGEHWIQFEMPEATAIDALVYTARSGGGNGTPTRYRIQTSMDGTNWETAKASTTVSINDATPRTFQFDEVKNCKFVRLVIEAGKNNNGSAAEIRLNKATVNPDKEGLADSIAKAKAVENKGWTDSTWTALQNKIAEAETLAANENANINDVDAMIKELDKKVTELRFESAPDTVDTSELQKAIDSVKDLNEDDYTEESWSHMQNALAKANDALTADTQIAVDTAKDALLSAIGALKEKPAEADHWTVTIDWDVEGVPASVVEVKKGEVLNIDDVKPEREGYTFKGLQANGEAWSMDTPVEGDLTLTAVWEKDEDPEPVQEYWTVTINWNVDGVEDSVVQVKKGEALNIDDIKPENPDYEFKGLQANGEAWSMDTPVEGDLTLTAVWEKKPDTPVTPDKADTSKLEKAVEDAKAVLDQVPEAFRAALEALIEEAEQLIAGVDSAQEDVDASHDKLNAHPFMEAIALKDKVAEAKDADKSKYDDDAWQNLQNSIEAAESMLNNGDANKDALGSTHSVLAAALANTKADDQKPGDDDNKPGDDDQKPGDDDKKPGADDQKPSDDDKKPGDSLDENGIYTLIYNTSSKVLHDPTCTHGPTTNRGELTGTLAELKAASKNYKPCDYCKDTVLMKAIWGDQGTVTVVGGTTTTNKGTNTGVAAAGWAGTFTAAAAGVLALLKKRNKK